MAAESMKALIKSHILHNSSSLVVLSTVSRATRLK